MTVDVRAKVFCNLGTVIQASVSDEALSARQGLIRCRGQVVLKGLLTPTVGSFVYFGWQKDNTIARLPRTLRVLSSFADPFRNQTTVQLGDKLVYLANLKGSKADPNEQEEKPETPDKPPTPVPQDGPAPIEFPKSEYEYEQGDSCYAPRPNEIPFLFGSKEAAERLKAIEQYLMAPARVQRQTALTIQASLVLRKCLAALGISQTGPGLIAQFTEDSFDLSSGYVNVIDQLLSNESQYGYLNENEILVTGFIEGDPTAGPLITTDNLIDLNGLNQGILPGQLVTVSVKGADLKPEVPPEPLPEPEPDPDPEPEPEPEPEADPGPNQNWDDGARPPVAGSQAETDRVRNWEYEEVVGYNQKALFYLEDGYEITFPFNTRTEVYTYYDKDDYVTKRITKTFTIIAAEAGSLLQAQLQNEYDNRPFGVSEFRVSSVLRSFANFEIRSGTREEFFYRTADVQDQGLPDVDLLCPGEEPIVAEELPPQRIEKVPTSQITYTYQSAVALLGQLNISGFDWSTYDLNSLPKYDVLTEKTIVTYYQNEPSGQTKTRTDRFIIHGNTQEGQQDTAEKGKTTTDQNGLNFLLDIASDLRFIDTTIAIQQDRTFGVQQRPNETDLAVEELKKEPATGTEKDTATNTQDVSLEQQSDTTESQPSLELDMPYGSDDGLVWTASDGFEFRGGNGGTLALRYARTQNAVLRGNRNGVALQIPAYVMPLYPLSFIYLEALSVTGAYRSNAMSWAMNSDGVLCSMDALFWGGVGGNGTPWFPVAPGITTLPAAPSISSASQAPGNALTTPTGFDVVAPGSVWSSLPAGQPPTYAKSIAPNALVPVVSEQVRLAAVIRSVVAVSELDYPLSLPTETAVLVTKAEITITTLLAAAVGALTISGQTAGLKRGYQLTAAAGSSLLTGYGAGSVRDYAIGTNAGTYTLSGQTAIVAYQRAPLAAESGSFALTGQDAEKRKGIIVAVDAAEFTVDGQLAGLQATRQLTADVGAVAASGQAAQLNYITPVYSSATYTGNQTARSINVGFKPGLVIIHKPTVPGYVFDKVRGPGKFWFTFFNSFSNAEFTVSESLTSFDAAGFSLGTSVSGNEDGISHRAFCWKEGGAATANTAGTIASTTSVSSEAGYSIFTYTGNDLNGATVGHGLGVNPELLLIKRLAGSNLGVNVYFSRLVGNNKYGEGNAFWNTSSTVIQTSTSSVVTLGTSSRVNLSSQLHVGLAFASVPGVSKIGTYTGAGTGVYAVSLGFQPRFVFVKSHNTTGDNTVYFANAGATGYASFIVLNTAGAAATSTTFQITSDGFSVDVGGIGNVSGGTSSAIYMAYA